MVSISYTHSPVAHTLNVRSNLYRLLKSATTVEPVKDYIESEVDMPTDIMRNFAALIWGDLDAGEHQVGGGEQVSVVKDEHATTIIIWKKG